MSVYSPTLSGSQDSRGRRPAESRRLKIKPISNAKLQYQQACAWRERACVRLPYIYAKRISCIGTG